jgi:hypothetical protein
MGRFFNYANNLTTIFGAILTTVSAVCIVTFVFLEIFAELKNRYLAILSYLILPGFFVTGLMAIPIGMWRRRRGLLASDATPEELERYPRLDFNDPHVRRLAGLVPGADRDQRGDLRFFHLFWGSNTWSR